ncbi:MAG: GTPase (G3E family) [Eubacterium sp.]|nr:GTPase (G3E family) [Eubacterium sp.]
MTKVDLITGFLGAGKTTFILDYAHALLERGERIGIIENDYGAINIDLMLLHRELGDKCRLEMVIGGDPDCHRRRLKTKLIAMGIDRYDRVLVEPSGVFDVEEFMDILYEEPLDHLLTPENVITVVDGERLRKEDYSENERYILAEQLTKAGMIFLSKAENESEDEIRKELNTLSAALKEIGCSRVLKREELILRRNGGISGTDMERLLRAGRKDASYIKRDILESGAFQSLFFFYPELPEEPVDRLMQRIFTDPGCKGLSRIKGFVRSTDCEEWLEINATAEHTEIRKSPVGQPVLIAVGEGIRQDVIGGYLRHFENQYRPAENAE